MILDAYNRGVSLIYLFVGGSATNDAGIGILNALGINALGPDRLLEPIGSNLTKLTALDDGHLKYWPELLAHWLSSLE